MQNQALISIVIPVLDRAHLIGETLDSIVAQTYSNWECIIVDDGSTDTTKEVIATYTEKDQRFKYTQRPTGRSKGGNAARNYGFEVSSGDFIQWFDSDDLMVATLLERQISQLIDSRKQFAVCLLSRYNSDFSKKIKDECEISINRNLYLDFIVKDAKVMLQTTLFRKNILDGFMLDESLCKSQEYDFFARFLKENHVLATYNNEVLVKVRRHDQSITGSNFKENPNKLKSALDVKLNIIKDLPYNVDNTIEYELWTSYFDILGYSFKFKMKKIFFKYILKNVFLSLKTLFSSVYLSMLFVLYLLTNFGYYYYPKGKKYLIR